MNIKKAKGHIADTVRAYLEKDEYGRYLIPQNKQRPLFLMGPPGIGKTEIMAQVAAELNIGLLSYSMTHHTRQSALGLPVIKRKNYRGEEFEASEYTMSEIISAVYDMTEKSGTENGILFLDEINCISETLMPIMLQFLQYKVFGGHRLPDGWVVVTAGNPPEYNSCVREFDVVTWDRLKRIDVEPDFEAWKEYAYSAHVHGSVLSYLEIKPRNFYRIEAEADGKSFVTARGWDDLSRIIAVYERLGIEADADLVKQYIRSKQIAEDFAVYYELYKKYRSDYRVGDILSGCADEKILSRAKAARFDERYSLLGLILEALGEESRGAAEAEEMLTEVKRRIEKLRGGADTDGECAEKIRADIDGLARERGRLKASNSLSDEKDGFIMRLSAALSRYLSRSVEGGFEAVREEFESETEDFKRRILKVKSHFSGAFGFCEQAFGSGEEMLIFVTELAANPTTARFIADYGCEEYFRHDKALMLHTRRLEIIEEIDKLAEDHN